MCDENTIGGACTYSEKRPHACSLRHPRFDLFVRMPSALLTVRRHRSLRERQGDERRARQDREGKGLGRVSSTALTCADRQIPIHVDAASGGFFAPFVSPKLEWDCVSA